MRCRMQMLQLRYDCSCFQFIHSNFWTIGSVSNDHYHFVEKDFSRFFLCSQATEGMAALHLAVKLKNYEPLEVILNTYRESSTLCRMEKFWINVMTAVGRRSCRVPILAMLKLLVHCWIVALIYAFVTMRIIAHYIEPHYRATLKQLPFYSKLDTI